MQDAITEAFVATMRGPVIGRTNPDYDDVRSLYNGMIDKHRSTDRTVRRRCRRCHLGQIRARKRSPRRRPRRGSQRTRSRQRRRRADDRPVDDEWRACRSRRPHGPRWARLHAGRCRPRDTCLWAGGAGRHRLHHGHSRPHIGRWHRLPDAQIRAHHRQSARSRCRAGRRQHCHRQQVR